MKKTYLNPELEIIKIQTMQMMAASITVDDNPIVDPGDIGAPGLNLDITEEVFSIDEDKFDFGTSESISNFE